MRAALGRRLFGAGCARAALAGAAGALWTKRAGVSELDWASAGPVFALAAVLFALAPLVQAAGFWLILRAGPSAAPARRARHWRSGHAGSSSGTHPRGRSATSTGFGNANGWAPTRPRCGRPRRTSNSSRSSPAPRSARSRSARAPLGALAALAGAVGLALLTRSRTVERLLRRMLARREVELPRLLAGRTLGLLAAVNSFGWRTRWESGSSSGR